MAVKHKYSAGELVCQRSKKVKLEFEILWMTIDKMTTCNFMSYHEFKCYICLERFKDFFNLPRIELIKKTILQFLRVCPSFVNTLRAFSTLSCMAKCPKKWKKRKMCLQKVF